MPRPKEDTRREQFTCAKCKHKAIITTLFKRSLIDGLPVRSIEGIRNNKPPMDCDCDCHVPWHLIHGTKPVLETADV